MNQNTPEEIECPNCGTKNKLNSKTELDSQTPICKKCWTSLTQENEEFHVPPPPKYNSSIVDKELKKKKIPIKILALFIVFVLIGVFYYYPNNKKILSNTLENTQSKKLGYQSNEENKSQYGEPKNSFPFRSIEDVKEKYPHFKTYDDAQILESLNELYFPNIPKETIAKNLNIDTKIFDEIKNKKILELEEKVRPIPASNAELNLKLYRELLELNPKNTKYQSKVNYYEKRLAEQEKAEQDRKYYIANLPEKKLPKNGNIQTFTSRNRIARFNIKSSGDSHYLIKLVESLSKNTVMTIFVHKNSDITVNVPLGDYEIKYASGKKWFGYEYLFGLETSYGKADENFSFYQLDQQIIGYSITLYKVHDGNFSIRIIDASEF